MGTAPTPGVGKRKKQAQAARVMHTITVRGETFPATAFRNLPLSILGKVQNQTGESLDFWMFPISTASVRVLCWISTLVHDPEPLTFAKFDADWLERFPDLMPSEVEAIEDDGLGDDPQP